jgi:Mg2+/Co2+ transporter CorB
MEPSVISMSASAIWGTAAAILLLLCMSAFFSGSETALTAASRGKLRSMAERKNRGAELALSIKEDNERMIGGILLGNNIANVLATALTTTLFTALLGASGVAAATFVMTVLVVIFAEVMPKTFAISAPERSAALAAPIVAMVIKVLAPVVAVVRAIVRAVLGAFGTRVDPDSDVLAVRDEIEGALHLGHSEGSVHKEERDRLLGALDLGDRTVEEIMLHRSGIEMIDAAMPPAQILDQCLASRHTRLPVYRDEPENIIGLIHSKDMLRTVDRLVRGDGGGVEAIASFDVTDAMMEPYFVPETTTLDDQMREFLRRHTHFALVVDEYGALQGLITLEDILEEIVGEITDEFDQPDEPVLTPDADGSYLIDGAMTIRDLNRATDWGLPDEEANTVAGLVIHEAQTIPTAGQVFSFHNFRFEVAAREANRITQLRIRPLG